MKTLIIYNSDVSESCSVLRNVKAFLTEKGVSVSTMAYSIADYENEDFALKEIRECDILIVIGGDGTILKNAKHASVFSKPVLGINGGTLGYLATVDKNELDALNKLITGEYTYEDRMMLNVSAEADGKELFSKDCLNDVVISRSAASTLVDISLKIGDDSVNYRADGFIAATPTGSTAYSMSAGGPVVDPLLECCVLTPVCPHTLLNRSIVVSADKEFTVTASARRGSEIFLSADGEKGIPLSDGTLLHFSRSKKKAKFIKLNDTSVYKIFSEKTTFK